LKSEIAAIEPTRSRGLESMSPVDLGVDRTFGDFFNGLPAADEPAPKGPAYVGLGTT
jgi:hypothetical protein